jgi:type 1 fimbriae regulatory protein FimB/type 1 fimbriae regulatory protein FimE
MLKRMAKSHLKANRGHDTRALQAYLGHKNIQHTVRYTELSPEPDALALAALIVKSLDELTPDAIESAAQRARKQRASG